MRGVYAAETEEAVKAEAIAAKMAVLLATARDRKLTVIDGRVQVAQLGPNVFNIWRLEKALDLEHSELGLEGAPAQLNLESADVPDIEVVKRDLKQAGEPLTGSEDALRRRWQVMKDEQRLQAEATARNSTKVSA